VHNLRKIFFILIFCFLISPVLAADISINNESSYTYIKWNWTNTNPIDIYIDGTLKEINTSIDYYLLSDLNMEEKHFIYLVDNITVNNTGYQETVTEYIVFPFLTLFLLLIWLICIILAIYSKNEVFGICGLIVSIIIVTTMLSSEQYLALIQVLTLVISLTVCYLVERANK